MMDTTSTYILDSIFDTLPSGMILCEADGAIVRINEKAREILAIDSTLQPRHLDQLPDWLAGLGSLIREASDDVNRAEIALNLPLREEESTIGYSLKLIQTPDGQVIKTMTCSDITQVLKDRLAMDKIKDELNQSKKLASIGTMIAGVAHELNNPLTGISMSTSLIRMNLERLKKSPVSVENMTLQESLEKALLEIGKITRANEKAAVLVSDLLAYSKPTQLVMVPMPLHELILDIVGALKSHPQFSLFTFKLEGETNRLINCDRVKLEQVFYNLFKNACDATDGKGTLTIFYTEETGADGRAHVVTHVRDNGPGIDKTVINRIFDPFFTTKGHSGVGLGLSISYRTVEQHGGLLSVESEKWQGTEFKVSVPIYLEEVEVKGQSAS